MARKAEIRYVNCYNVGSLAFKVDLSPVPQKKQTTNLPKQRKRKKILIHVDPVAVAGVCLAFVMLIMMVVGLCQLSAAKQQATRMQSYVMHLQEQNRALDAQYHAGFDPEEIRQIATEMGMVPIEQVQHIQISVPATEPVQKPTVWENVYTFLVGLFA